MKKNISSMNGMKIQVLRNIKEKRHFHPEIEIIFVVSGMLCVDTKDSHYELSKKDIILFNSNNYHKVEYIGDTVICRVYISYKMLAQVVNNGNYIFYCNSVSDKANSYIELQNIMKRIVFSYAGQERQTECLRYGLVFELLDVLIENFQKNGDCFKYKKGNKENEQIQYIINYVNLNFQNSISLSKLAQEMYTSTSTLSRFFKNQLGIYFGDFVNQVRLNYAVKDLLETDKTITKIAVDCGFSNASIFSKTFQSTYDMSPTLYRKQQLMKKDSLEESLELDKEKLRQEINLLQQEEGKKTLSEEINVQVSVKEEKNYKKFWNIVLNAGASHNLILANVQSHISYLVEHLNFKYVRIWNIFSKKLMIQRNNNDFNYNFNMVDIILDFLISNDVKPFIDFVKKPDCAIKAEDETIYYEEDYIDFDNMKQWNRMFENFILHIIKRYGKEEVEGWKYEFSLDVRPNRFYIKDDNESFEELFEHSFKFIKKHIPRAEVGGFGAVIDLNSDKLLDRLKYCKEKECIPDFVSIICFPYIQVEKSNKVFTKRITSEFAVSNQVKKARNNLDEYSFKKCKLYVTEWNNSLSSRNYLNDSCFRGAYVAKMINELWDIPDLMGIWMGSDLVSSHYDTSRIANGASGIITKDKIRKPVYYALSFLDRMGSKFIEKGENYIITSNGGNSYYILCFNYKEYNCNYYLQDEDNLDISELSELFENNDDLKLNIDLIGMPENQKFIIKKHTVNKEYGSILGQWSKFQYEKDIEGSDLKYLSEICIPNITMEKQIVKNEVLQIYTILKSHEISLIHIYEDN